MATWLRIIGISLNAIGAIVLAVRVKSIVDALVMAQEANDLNFRILMDLLNGQSQKAPLVVGMNEQAARQQKAGAWLLVVGFSAIAVGNALVGLSWYIDAQE